MCGALDCKSCGPAQGYYEDYSDDDYDPREEDLVWDERRLEDLDMPVWEGDDD